MMFGTREYLRNLFFMYFHKVLSWVKFGLWGPFYVSPQARLTGVENIQIGEGARVFANAELNTSGAPSALPYKKSKCTGKIRIGSNTVIRSNVSLMTYGGSIAIDDSVSIHPYTIIYGLGGVSIGKNVGIASHAVIIAANHIFSDSKVPFREQGQTAKGIIIKDDVWLGTRVTVLDGVTIGTGAVIGAGAVVNKNIPDFAVAVGVPAKVIKYRGQ
jgi:acetyltransferase-like isoleucine patch superfamily enzyme